MKVTDMPKDYVPTNSPLIVDSDPNATRTKAIEKFMANPGQKPLINLGKFLTVVAPYGLRQKPIYITFLGFRFVFSKIALGRDYMLPEGIIRIRVQQGRSHKFQSPNIPTSDAGTIK